MNKIILLIGLLTYSSVGWSQKIWMECIFDDQSYLSGIYVYDTDLEITDELKVIRRHRGQWWKLCVSGQSVCDHLNDRSIRWLESHGGYTVNVELDFKYKRVFTYRDYYDEKNKLQSDSNYYKCEKYEPE